MKIQKAVLSIGAVVAIGLGSINPVQADEFKLLQNFLNGISLFGGGAEPAPNSTIEVGPVIQPVEPKRDREKIRPVAPANPGDNPTGINVDPTRKP